MITVGISSDGKLIAITHWDAEKQTPIVTSMVSRHYALVLSSILKETSLALGTVEFPEQGEK